MYKVWISESNLADFTKQKLSLFQVRDVESSKRKFSVSFLVSKLYICNM